jgi:hypothetical protein
MVLPLLSMILRGDSPGREEEVYEFTGGGLRVFKLID